MKEFELKDQGTETDLTPQEDIILWSHKVFDEYSSMPQENHKQRSKAERFVKNVALEVLSDPEKLGIAAAIWKTKEEEIPEGKKSFYSVISDSASELAEERWADFTSEQLAGLVRVFANNELSSEMVEEILKSYFNGPESPEEKVDCLYNFTYGVLDLINDKKSLEQGVRISNFHTDILPKNSDFYRDYAVATWVIDNDNLLRKACCVDHVTHQLCTLTTLDPELVKKGLWQFLQTDSLLKSSLDQYFRKTIKTISIEEYETRVRLLNEFYSMGDIMEVDWTNLDEYKKWPFNILMGGKDPLRAKYDYLVKTRIELKKYAELVRESFRNAGDTEFSFTRVIQPDGYSLEIYFPGPLYGEKRSKVIKHILKRYPLDQKYKDEIASKEILMSEFNIPSDPAIQGFDTFETESFCFTYHKVRGAEVKRHSILALEDIGFPMPVVGEGQNIEEINEGFAREIKSKQIRYLNKRGIRIPLKSETLQKFGYRYIDFYKDGAEIRAEISVNDLVYLVKLDQNFNFDFEGKVFDSVLLGDFLKFTLLSLLKPILCEEDIKGEQGQEISQEEKEVVTRMGHLRWLPLGQKYSDQAVKNFLEKEGGDLAVKDLERKMDAQRKQDPHLGHFTTYVQAVTEPEGNLPPLTLNLSGKLVCFDNPGRSNEANDYAKGLVE